MAEKKKDWQNGIEEYPFDFGRYIEERLREIPDLDERRFARKVLLDGLGRGIRCMEEKYKQLEQRVYEELQPEGNRYETVITIVEKQHYDPRNQTLFPVIPGDLGEPGAGEPGLVGTVFLELGWEAGRPFREGKKYGGVVRREGKERPALFRLQQAKRYRKAVEELYQAFQDNQIPWVTVNTAYLDQFFDVFLVESEEEGQRSRGRTPAWEDCGIWFGEDRQFVRYGWVPLWNIEAIPFRSTRFMTPCPDGISYEHEFALDERKESDGYLVSGNEDILEIRHEKGRIVVRSEKEIFEGWQVLRLAQGEMADSPGYREPLLGNHRRDSFIRRLADNSRGSLMTWADLSRRILELDIRDYLEVDGYEIREPSREEPREEGMNWFLPEGLFPMEGRKVLLLKFRARRPGYYLNESMVRFVVSQLQLEIGEYRCEGMMV